MENKIICFIRSTVQIQLPLVSKGNLKQKLLNNVESCQCGLVDEMLNLDWEIWVQIFTWAMKPMEGGDDALSVHTILSFLD